MLTVWRAWLIIRSTLEVLKIDKYRTLHMLNLLYATLGRAGLLMHRFDGAIYGTYGKIVIVLY